MIAVFTRTQRDFDEVRFLPKNNFIRIRDEYSLMGRRFTGVIAMYGFFNDNGVYEAYNLLNLRQPELFEKRDKDGNVFIK